LVKQEPIKKGYTSIETNFTEYRPICRVKEPIFGAY
jgi:cysteine synthase A